MIPIGGAAGQPTRFHYRLLDRAFGKQARAAASPALIRDTRTPQSYFSKVTTPPCLVPGSLESKPEPR